MPSAPDAIILCGGAGLRLRSVTCAPKSMATVAGRPFLDLLLLQLKRHRFERVILAVGYRSGTIRSHFGERVFGLQVAYSTELGPLGTGGALRQAADLVESDLVLVMNGDTYTDTDLQKFEQLHRLSQADVSVLVVPVDGREDCGAVMVDHDDRIAAFCEKKKSPGSKFINAGMYLMSPQTAQDLPSGVQLSLELEVFPQWLAAGKHIRAHADKANCVDIGTPERYRTAQSVLAKVENPEGSPEYQ